MVAGVFLFVHITKLFSWNKKFPLYLPYYGLQYKLYNSKLLNTDYFM